MFTVTDLDTDKKFSVGSPTSSIIVPDKYGNTTKALIFGVFEGLDDLAINEETTLLDKKNCFLKVLIIIKRFQYVNIHIPMYQDLIKVMCMYYGIFIMNES